MAFAPAAPAPLPRVAAIVSALAALHIAIVIASNYLVQLPVTLLGFHSTWGAFSFPLIFLATDLTVRLLGKAQARRVIACAMLPALLASCAVGALFQEGRFNGWSALGAPGSVVVRIALGSFAAYVLGQLLDIQVFDRVRRNSRAWWPAPALASVFGQALDTAAFFSIAFWRSANPFMAAHWVEIALVDYAIKLGFSLLLLVPVYGVALTALTRALRGMRASGAPVAAVQ